MPLSQTPSPPYLPPPMQEEKHGFRRLCSESSNKCAVKWHLGVMLKSTKPSSTALRAKAE
eukprot:9434689-Alexandrium_andersonii.AAC.1